MSKRNPNQPIDRGIPKDLLGFEAELAALRPREASLDRDRLMFEAGRASMPSPRTRWAWPLTTVAMTSVAACLAIMLFFQSPSVIERVKIVEIERESPVEVAVDDAAPAVAVVVPTSIATAEPPIVVGPVKRRTAASVVPRAGLEFRLFEHLMGQPSVPISTTVPPPEDESADEQLSPRSVPNLLDRSASSALEETLSPQLESTHSYEERAPA